MCLSGNESILIFPPETEISLNALSFAMELRKRFDILSLFAEVAAEQGDTVSSFRLCNCVQEVVDLLLALDEVDLRTITYASSLSRICLPILSLVRSEDMFRFSDVLFRAIKSIITLYRQDEDPSKNEFIRNQLNELNELPFSPFADESNNQLARLNASFFSKAKQIISEYQLEGFPDARRDYHEWARRVIPVLVKISPMSCPVLINCIYIELLGLSQDYFLLPES